MIHLITTAGLDAYATDADDAARLLADHFEMTVGAGPVRWKITGPTGHLHVGQITIAPAGPAVGDFLADTVEEIRHHLAAEADQGAGTDHVKAGS